MDFEELYEKIESTLGDPRINIAKDDTETGYKFMVLELAPPRIIVGWEHLDDYDELGFTTEQAQEAAEFYLQLMN